MSRIIFKLVAFIVCVIFSLAIIAQSTSTITPQNSIKVDEGDSKEEIIRKAAHIIPTSNQYQALQNEFIAFIHFGPNTFTRMEWGNGFENPSIFALEKLDTDQWCEAMKAAGMKLVIITVKHHDGFVLWQSRYTKHGIMSSPFKDGKGDILKELSASCEKYGLKLGVYLSPADLFQIENKEGLYGNLSEYTDRTIPKVVKGRPFKSKKTFTFSVDDYNEYFLNQLFELLTEYGPIHEVWFDGAHPKRKGGQTYNYLAWKELIRELAPEAVIFGKEDIRWCGNESGGTRDTEWNVMPYQDDPNQMSRFGDLTAKDLGSRQKLYAGNYLHYQQAETNTSIREGWFFRDDNKQKVRNADDVFDIYERSVGGNSTFLLNIPPNREGRFSDEDVEVLSTVGERIADTYGSNLMKGVSGPAEVLDDDLLTHTLLDGEQEQLEFAFVKRVAINRLVIQEAICTHGERVEEHAVDVWSGGQWKEVARASNIGYKRILRFPEVSTEKIRIRILKKRATVAIASVSAHYYKTKPPVLEIVRNSGGEVLIQPKKHEFGWKPHGEESALNLNRGTKIYYSIDGSEPTASSNLYEHRFNLSSGTVRAMSVVNDEMGSITSQEFGPAKSAWKVMGSSGQKENHPATHAWDADPKTYWKSKVTAGGADFLAINLGNEHVIKGFTYTPQQEDSGGMIDRGVILASKDGLKWREVERFQFGNLINDPRTRLHILNSPITTKYIKLQVTSLSGQGKAAAIAEIDFLVH